MLLTKRKRNYQILIKFPFKLFSPLRFRVTEEFPFLAPPQLSPAEELRLFDDKGRGIRIEFDFFSSYPIPDSKL